MHIGKLKKRLEKANDEMPVVIEVGGKFYEVLTAKVFNNPLRGGASRYFSVVASQEVKRDDLRNAE